jgi:hypothetical protein
MVNNVIPFSAFYDGAQLIKFKVMMDSLDIMKHLVFYHF